MVRVTCANTAAATTTTIDNTRVSQRSQDRTCQTLCMYVASLRSPIKAYLSRGRGIGGGAKRQDDRVGVPINPNACVDMDCDGHQMVQAILFTVVIGSVVTKRVVGRGGDWH